MSNYAYFGADSHVAVSDLTTAITGDLDVRLRVRAVDWTPAAAVRLAAQSHDANKWSWQFYLHATGVLAFQYSTDGVNVTTKASTAVLGTTAGLTDNVSDIWVKVLHDVDNGAGGNDILFYYSANGIDWTKLGNTVTTAGAVTRFNTVAPFTVGSLASASVAWRGRIYMAEIRSGIDGAVVASPDFTTWDVGDTAKADTQGNTWTLTDATILQDWSQVAGQNRRFARR